MTTICITCARELPEDARPCPDCRPAPSEAPARKPLDNFGRSALEAAVGGGGDFARALYRAAARDRRVS